MHCFNNFPLPDPLPYLVSETVKPHMNLFEELYECGWKVACFQAESWAGSAWERGYVTVTACCLNSSSGCTDCVTLVHEVSQYICLSILHHLITIDKVMCNKKQRSRERANRVKKLMDLANTIKIAWLVRQIQLVHTISAWCCIKHLNSPL